MPMKLDVLNRIYREAVVAIIRAESSSGLLKAAEALHAGGLSVLEVTMTTPGALDVIKLAGEHFGNEVCFGAGSILDTETARLAILAGARFLVTPTLEVDVIRVANRYSVPVMMGCYTPSEIKTAWEQGADLVKLFPAAHGGLAYLKAVRAPLPQVEFVPTGGIDLENAVDFLRAGAFALGVGNTLISADLLQSQDYAEITRRAAAFRTLVETVRA
jgi:2-dehydro-3-deoxyphosphogluconate aldolase / (4S)-4-hydroxy-2-oxoglutarate aldolase